MQAAISQLMSDIQFFLVLKILMREKASAYNLPILGTIKSPFSSLQP